MSISPLGVISEIYVSNFRELITYPWPQVNNVLSIYQIFVKLLPITGLKETMLLMTNDNLLYCFDHKIFVDHREIFEIYIFLIVKALHHDSA